jgi:two-component system cell cycle sensor histidine kinase/response regulator CckA
MRAGRGIGEITVNTQAQQKVLLVDDEWSVRVYVANVLQGDGFDVLEAADGVDALALLLQMRGAVDVLVTDVQMPRMTGIDLVEKVKTEFPSIPVVYISGDHLTKELHNPSHCVVFVQKPFRPRAILDAVRSVIPIAEASSGFGA